MVGPLPDSDARALIATTRGDRTGEELIREAGGHPLFLAELAGWHEPAPLGRGLVVLLWINFASFLWRTAFRFAFSARTYGWREGVRAVLRVPFANVIAIMAGRRAIAAYLRSLMGGAVRWEKTVHRQHASAFVAPAPARAAR